MAESLVFGKLCPVNKNGGFAVKAFSFWKVVRCEKKLFVGTRLKAVNFESRMLVYRSCLPIMTDFEKLSDLVAFKSVDAIKIAKLS